MRRSGSSLIECVVYIAISALIMTFIGMITVKLYTTLRHITYKSDEYIRLYAIIDAYARDVSEAAQEGWEVLPRSCSFFRNHQKCYWWCEGNRLMRSYNKAVSVVAYTIDHFENEIYTHKGMVVGLGVCCGYKAYRVKRFIALTAGALKCS